MRVPSDHVIRAWEHTWKARKVHICANCGGPIHRGTRYRREVASDQSRRNETFYNLHFHLDCEQPWWQAADEPRLATVGRVSKKVPELSALDPEWANIPLTIKVSTQMLGTIHWDIPEELRRRLLAAKRKSDMLAAIHEIERAFIIFVTALGQALGNRRQAKRLGYHLEELQAFLDGKPFLSLKS